MMDKSQARIETLKLWQCNSVTKFDLFKIIF